MQPGFSVCSRGGQNKARRLHFGIKVIVILLRGESAAKTEILEI